MQTISSKILLTNALSQHWGLCEEIQYMFGLKSSVAQALWWVIILTYSYIPLERFFNRFYHWFTKIDGLDGRQLWPNTQHHWPACEDCSLQASQGHYWYFRHNKGHYWNIGEASRLPRHNCYQLWVAIHLKVLVIAMLFFRHQEKILHRLLIINERPDWEVV